MFIKKETCFKASTVYISILRRLQLADEISKTLHVSSYFFTCKLDYPYLNSHQKSFRIKSDSKIVSDTQQISRLAILVAFKKAVLFH